MKRNEKKKRKKKRNEKKWKDMENMKTKNKNK